MVTQGAKSVVSKIGCTFFLGRFLELLCLAEESHILMVKTGRKVWADPKLLWMSFGEKTLTFMQFYRKLMCVMFCTSRICNMFYFAFLPSVFQIWQHCVIASIK